MSKGKIGRKYAKNRLADYIDAVYKYDLLCQHNVVNAKSVSEISDKDFQEFSSQVTKTANSYKRMLDDCAGKIISKRVKADYNKILP